MTASLAGPSPGVLVEKIDQFVARRLGLLGAGAEFAGDAMAEVVPQKLAADGAERLLHRPDLRQDVGAIAVILDHLL